jgi:hypothetical protein
MALKLQMQQEFCVGYKYVHSAAQDLSIADVIINHFNELNLN